MSPQPWGPVVERRQLRRFEQPAQIASPFVGHRRRRASLRNPSLAVDIIASMVIASGAFILWLAS